MNAANVAMKLTREERQGAKALLRRILPAFVTAAVSALMNRAGLPGGYSPFGAGWIAAAPDEYAAVAVVGGMIGCLTGGGLLSLEGLRRVATLLAVGGIRWALGELRPVNRAKYYPFFTALAGTLLTGSVMSGAGGSLFSYTTLYYAAEGVMAGIAAMVFSGGSAVLSAADDRPRWEKRVSVSVMLTLCAAALPLCRIEVLQLSPVLILFHTAVLLTLPARREVGGAVGGTVVGCMTALSEYSLYQGTICPIAGLLAGYAVRYGRVFAASVYIAVCVTGNFASGRMDYSFAAEAALGGLLSCLVPREMLQLSRYTTSVGTRPASMRARLAMAAGLTREREAVYEGGTRSEIAEVMGRLRRSSEALTGVTNVVEQVSDKLEKCGNSSEREMYRRAVEKVCASCARRENCCGAGKEGEKTRVKRLAAAFGERDPADSKKISQALGISCVREEQLLGELRSQGSYRLAESSARRRLAQARAAADDQLGGVGMMLGALCDELGTSACDSVTDDLAAPLRECGYELLRADSHRNRGGGRRLSLTLREMGHAALEREELGTYIGECLRCRFDVPTLTELSDEQEGVFLTELRQMPVYALRVFAAQHCCNGGKWCGDAVERFEDGEGCAYMLLSDGMGSGGRAAIDGALTCGLFSRLLKGGFGDESAVKIVNASLVLKSGEESLATLDCLRLNLYNGQAHFCKAGAAQSYHVRGGVVNRIDVPSLPLGILRTTDTSQYCLTAEAGDLFVMLSDGVPTDDSQWFEKLLAQYDGGSPEQLVRFLLRRAVEKRPAGEDDDITVMVGVVGNV